MQQGRSVWIALGLLLLVNLLGLSQIVTSQPLRDDGDTAKMLEEIRASGGLAGAFRWFTGDWMLENHFYRPITGFSMSLDYALYGEKGWGYRLTNWLLCLFTAWGTYFCMRRFVQWARLGLDVILAVPLLAALAFSLQQTGSMLLLSNLSAWWLVAIVILTWYGRRGRREDEIDRVNGSDLSEPFEQPEIGTSGSEPRIRNHPKSAFLYSLLAIGAMLWGWDRLTGFEFTRVIAWVPSRTALLMTCFAVWAMICLWRAGDSRSWKWLAVGLILFALAQGAYEQTIMLVPLIGLLALMSRHEWGRWWAWAVAGGVVCVALLYLSLRFALVPVELSGYQQQQIRGSVSVWAISFVGEMMPVASQWSYWRSFSFDPYLWLFKQPWDHLVMLLAYTGVIWAFTRKWRWFGACLLWQFLTFLPVSFLHWFEHYAYLPQIGKNALDMGLLWLGAKALYVNGLPLAIRIEGQAHRQSSTPLADELSDP